MDDMQTGTALPPLAADDPGFTKTATDPEIEAQIRAELAARDKALEGQD